MNAGLSVIDCRATRSKARAFIAKWASTWPTVQFGSRLAFLKSSSVSVDTNESRPWCAVDTVSSVTVGAGIPTMVATKS